MRAGRCSPSTPWHQPMTSIVARCLDIQVLGPREPRHEEKQGEQYERRTRTLFVHFLDGSTSTVRIGPT